MPRSTNSVSSRKRRRRTLSQASGYWGKKSIIYRYAKDAVDRAGQYAYRDRRKKKTTWRQLWIIRINAACRSHDINYSRFMHGLKVAGIELDRKSLSEIAINDESAFNVLVEKSIEANKAA